MANGQRSDTDSIPMQDLTHTAVSSFLITPLRRHIDREALQEKPHRHNFQEIIWIRSGKGKHRIDDKILHLQPHTFYLISQGQVHDFLEGTDLDGYLIRFADDFLPGKHTSSSFYFSLLSKIFPVNAIHLMQREDVASIGSLLDQLLREYRLPPNEYGKQAVLQHLLLVLLVLLERQNRNLAFEMEDEKEEEKKKYLEFLHLLEEEYYKEHNFSSYAMRLGVLSRKLASIIKCYSGKSAKKLILERILLEAKRMLSFTNSNIKQITYDLGFDDTAYFSRIFKSHTGFTPLEYRRNQKCLI